jgi:hypothetical protein
MILPLRRRHRIAFLALALALPGLYVAGLLARRAVPPVGEIPARTAAHRGEAEGPLVASLETLGGLPVRSRITRAGEGFVLRLDVREELARPELLVYWSAAGAKDAEASVLPADAVLLGRLDTALPSFHPLPARALGSGGALLLYSLAEGRVAAREPLPAVGGSGGGGP